MKIGSVKKKLNVMLVIGLLFMMSVLTVPIFSQSTLAVDNSEDPPHELPWEGYYVNINATTLTKDDRGKVLSLILSSQKYKELKNFLIHNHFTPKIDESIVTEIQRYENKSILDEYITVYIPFKSHNNDENAGISAIIKNSEIIDISGGFCYISPYRAYLNLNTFTGTGSQLNNIQLLVELSGNVITLTTIVNGDILSTQQILTTQPTLEYAHIYWFWWGFKIVFSEWETATLIGVIGSISLLSSIIALLCPAAAPVAGIIAVILSAVATSLWFIDFLGGYKGIYVVKIWFNGGYVWHN